MGPARCPSLVRIVGVNGQPAAVVMSGNSSGADRHTFAKAAGTEGGIGVCSLFDHNSQAGPSFDGADGEVEWCIIRGTQPNTIDGTFGDGIVIGYSQAASARILGTLVESSARAGISNFGASVALGSSVVSCSAFDVDGENGPSRFRFTDLGGNLCGCPNATASCQAKSAGLAPPPPLPPPPAPSP